MSKFISLQVEDAQQAFVSVDHIVALHEEEGKACLTFSSGSMKVEETLEQVKEKIDG